MPFAVLGSAGRGESLLAMDQDNALVFADGEPDGAEDRWFAALGAHVADILHEVGVPYCKGGVMAKNPQWRGSLATWRERIADWIGALQPAGPAVGRHLLRYARRARRRRSLPTLWREAFDAADGQIAFAKLLVEAAGRGGKRARNFRRLQDRKAASI